MVISCYYFCKTGAPVINLYFAARDKIVIKQMGKEMHTDVFRRCERLETTKG